MATTKATTYSDMLNEYLAYDMLEKEFKSMNWLLSNCNWDKSWAGGKLILPFQSAIGSSVRMGALTAENDVAESTYIRAYIDGYKEAYATLKFNSRDLFDHGKISEQNFLKLLPDQLENTMDYFKQTVSIQVLGGKALDGVATAFDAATDVLAVNHPERFVINQKLIVYDGTTTATGYVKAINMNTGVITFVTARGGSTAVDLAGLVEANTKVYVEDGQTTYFQSLKDMLLPAAQGGSDSWCNKTKTDSPFTQPILYDAGGSGGTGDWGTGTGVTKNDILSLVFDSMRKGFQRGASPKKYLMSWKHYSSAIKQIETGSGAYKNVKPEVQYANASEITVGGIGGTCSLVGVREFDDDWICGIDPAWLDFKTGKSPFEVLKSPDGLSFYTIRATTGYTYLTDIRLAGDFVYRKPYTAVSIYNIPNYNAN